MDRLRISLVPKEWSLRLAFVLGALCVAVAGCTSYQTIYPPTTTTAGPLPSPTFGSSSVTSTVTSTGGDDDVTLPTPGGFSGSATLPIASPSPGTQLTTTISASPPPGGPPMLAELRQAQSERATLQSGISPVLYLTLETNGPLTETGDPVFTIDLPASIAAVTPLNYFLAIYEFGGWQLGYAGPDLLSTGQSTLMLTGAFPLVFSAGIPDYLALYAQSVDAPVPTPPPSPSPAPSGAVGIGVQ